MQERQKMQKINRCNEKYKELIIASGSIMLKIMWPKTKMYYILPMLCVKVY